jgi:hypothetical protein
MDSLPNYHPNASPLTGESFRVVHQPSTKKDKMSFPKIAIHKNSCIVTLGLKITFV